MIIELKMFAKNSPILSETKEFKHNIRNKFEAYSLFLVSPFLALLYSLFHLRSRHTKNILWFFSGFLGYSFVVSNPDMDANRYKTYLEFLHTQSFSFVQYFFSHLYKGGNEGKTDLYQFLLTYGVSRFTDDFRIFYCIVGLVFGYFYSRNLFYIINKLDRNRSILILLLLISFALVVPIWNINGLRFYTAAHIFFFGVTQYLETKKYKYFFITILSVLVHFSFAIPIVLFVIKLLMGNNKWVFLLGFIISIGFVKVDASMLFRNAKNAPAAVKKKALGYTNKDYIKKINKLRYNTNWYVSGSTIFLTYYIGFMLIGIFIFFTKKLRNNNLDSLFYLAMLFFSVSYVFKDLPSMGRFVAISNMFSLTIIVLVVNQLIKQKYQYPLLFLSAPPLILFIVVTFRIGFDFIGTSTIFLNPLLLPFFDNGVALIDLIK